MTDIRDPSVVRRYLEQQARQDFGVFAIRAFGELNGTPLIMNWHIWAIAHHLMKVFLGDTRRLMITIPPRFLKSFLASVCYPAWILGKDPRARVICCSYNQKLAEEFAHETIKLMQTPFYRRVFPNTHLDPKKCRAEIMATTRGGQRRATSVGGTLTSIGGDYIIIDDPIKADEAQSEVARDTAMRWFSGTVTSRFNQPKKGRMVLIAQRLHMEDLPGQLLESGYWDLLELPMVEWIERRVEIARGKFGTRNPGNILHEERFGEEEIAQFRKDMGERDFEAQYNQRPMPPGGALFKLEWLQRYDSPPPPRKLELIVQSWDTAYDIQECHDYSVCTTWGLSGKNCYLLDVFRDKLEFPDLQRAVFTQKDKWKADLAIVENAGSGKSIYQNIRQNRRLTWLVAKGPEGSKQDRASQQTPKFERGEIFVPRDAPWLRAFEDELASFPHSRHDDQVDSVTQFLASLDTGNIHRLADLARRS